MKVLRAATLGSNFTASYKTRVYNINKVQKLKKFIKIIINKISQFF